MMVVGGGGGDVDDDDGDDDGDGDDDDDDDDDEDDDDGDKYILNDVCGCNGGKETTNDVRGNDNVHHRVGRRQCLSREGFVPDLGAPEPATPGTVRSQRTKGE